MSLTIQQSIGLCGILKLVLLRKLFIILLIILIMQKSLMVNCKLLRLRKTTKDLITQLLFLKHKIYSIFDMVELRLVLSCRKLLDLYPDFGCCRKMRGMVIGHGAERSMLWNIRTTKTEFSA